ncbi:DEAD/DEAH box helicase [Frankia sp. AgB1.9]|uniref:DEAD/DEAH box helicase n=1 Tax=unclassified Frankia TaxID=2632575 RepID=UPI0019333613|nr:MULTISPECIES: DEAD/DEAH box helicase [unclassified Frankia]MBL7487498.1 DEAD/DEAH box helicase [Frankia sp. AgW1.1]MBL7547460.1 DEAD/DEAH box helicase [Frankia sp. AgB1.9]MBL7618764.1 DEAD/DEAH box helicase [Frankia sp. AgB1.8]
MNKEERQQLEATIAEVGGWAGQAKSIVDDRATIERLATEAQNRLRRALVDVPRDGATAWRVLPLGSGDDQALQALARRTQLPLLNDDDAAAVRRSAAAQNSVNQARLLLSARRFISSRAKRDSGQDAATFLTGYRARGLSRGLPGLLDRLSQEGYGYRTISRVEAPSDDVGLSRSLGNPGVPELIDSQAVAGLGQAVTEIDRALRDEAAFREAAIEAGNRVRQAETRRLLAGMPVDRLKETTRDRLPLKTLTDAHIDTVATVLDRGRRLEALPGLGPVSATRILGAAQTLWQWTYDEMPTRIDIKRRSPEAAELLRRLGAWDATRKLRNASSDVARAKELDRLGRSLDSRHSHLVLFSSSSLGTSEFLAGVDAVRSRAAQLAGKHLKRPQAADPWEDFLSRPADYFGMLAELGLTSEDETKSHGDLPDQIVEAIRALSLNTEYLTVGSLRGYQSFGARFALVQRKVIIGDEMGLGKTIEALAVLAHLRAQGHQHALVICPAAVVTNWVREISSKSKLRSHRVHGAFDREFAARSWIRGGGVAVTTFDTLAWFMPTLTQVKDLGCVVVDEAHYIKNPAAKRSQNVAAVLQRSDRAVFLTGTPLENRLEEFANLVRNLQPELVIDTSGLSPRRFRRQVAPAYLRRNQEDVLTELPELVEVDEWLPLSDADLAAYRAAVAEGNFMAMRQAALRHGERSTKIQRLKEIVAEARDNGRRVIVFSYFKDVLRQVVDELPGTVIGPLIGSVAPDERQRMVDEFSAASRGAVLVAQIIAGGQGLNIQAASVVVICEPQLKPTTESQAIARAHRMGQLESVQVHRLLSEEGVDQRITEILARKRAIFDNFARASATADSAPEAFDVSEAELTREVIAAERLRLFAPPAAEPAEAAAD